MVEAAEHGDPCRRLLPKSDMWPVLLVVGDVLGGDPLKMILVEDNHMVEELAPN